MAGRNDPEVVEGRLSPLEELVALLIALELLLGVDEQCHARIEGIDLHRVIDDQVARDERVDLLGAGFVAGHAHDGLAHGGQVDDGRYAGEVLQNDPAGAERDLGLGHVGGVVGGERLDVVVGDDPSVVLAENGLEQHLDGVRE